MVVAEAAALRAFVRAEQAPDVKDDEDDDELSQSKAFGRDSQRDDDPT